jgi:hypothetical protein
LRKSNSPNSNLLRQRKKQNNAIKITNIFCFTKCLKKRLFIYMATRPTY